ncbi:hypothetical protein HID58_066393, partial [Brassica napus]
IPALLAAPLESPPGFPTMFPELSKEDRQAAMMYVSHADETERRARILRVQHSIENAKDDDTSVPIRISHNLNKDKGLVFGYSHGDDSNSESNNTNTLHAVSAPALLKDKEDRAATSGEQSASSNFQINGSTVFRLGNTTSSGYTGTSRSKRIDRKRPPAWVRRVRTNRYGAGAIAVSQGASLQRGRFYFDKRMFGKRGVEEAIIHGWEAENDSTELAKLKKASDWNSKTKIERLQTELEKESSKRVVNLALKVSDLLIEGTSVWNQPLLRQTFTPEDVQRILLIKPCVNQEDSVRWGFSKDGRYNTRSGYKLLEALTDFNHPQARNLKAFAICFSFVKRQKKFGTLPTFHYLKLVYNSNEGDSNTRSVFPWLVWELWKARNALAFENKTVTAYTIASRAFEEASSWQKTMILKSNTEIVDDV